MRAICQPSDWLGRRSGEHWVGRLLGRRVSIYLTRALVHTRVRPDDVTIVMVAVGLAGAAALSLPGIVGALLCVFAIFLYLVLDCVDGELARWRGISSIRGAYLDRLGHYIVEASLFAMFGYRIGGQWSSGWVSVGLATSVFVLIAKAETDLVLASGGRSSEGGDDDVVQPRADSLHLARRLTHPLKIHRLTGAAEASLAILAASLLAVAGWNDAEKWLLILFLIVSIAVAFGHGLVILNSGRFEPQEDR